MVLEKRSSFEKDYVDRGMQTDSLDSPSRMPAPITQQSARINFLIDKAVLTDSTENCLEHAQFFGSRQLHHAYSHSRDSLDAGPPGLVEVTRRTRKHARLGYRSSGAHSTTNRVVSLPETAPLCSIKNILESATLRVASMSERPKPDISLQSASLLDAFEVSASTENSYLTADEGPYLTRRCGMQASDVPRTPSPPSSPESVMIIENSVHLPQSFLRHNSALKSHPTHDSDDGWITWASSPPRPIPALHGPLSLPYARCPSGAEGSIIEGPEDLSRIIWGLGTDDAQPASSRVSSHHTLEATLNKATVNKSQPNFPPRLQKPQNHPPQNSSPRTHVTAADVSTRPVPMVGDQDRRTHTALRQRAIEILGSRHPGHQYSDEAILEYMSQTGATKVTHTWNPAYRLHDRWTRESFGQDFHVFDKERGLGLDWQPAFGQQNLKTSSIDARGKHLADYLKASAPAFVPASLATAHPYPRIFIEPRPNELAQASSLPSRRSSAIEIAHKYHQQQQLQNALPTPPGSSSTQWSPYFTAYQDNSRSPDLVNSLPQRLSVIQAQQQYSTGDSSQQLRRFVYERMGDMDTSTKASLGAAAQIDPSANPRLAMQCSPDVSSSLARFLQHRNIVTSPSLMSPPHPGPPPNTPLPPLPNRSAKNHIDRPSLFTTPPSPTSPEARTRSVSYQQPRSIPLARLIQRRLSSVPEEDLSSFVERTRSPSPSSSMPNSSAFHPQTQFPPSWQQKPLQDRADTRNPRTPSPFATALAPQTRAPQKFDRSVLNKVEGVPVKVKLPNRPRVKKPVAEKEGDGHRTSTHHQRRNLRGKKVKALNPTQTAAIN